MLPAWLLAPFRPSVDPQALQRAAHEAAVQPDASVAALEEHGLSLIWAHSLEAAGVALDEQLRDRFRALRRQAAMRDLAQQSAMERAAKALDDAGVAYVAFKGAHLARVIYGSPELRPSLDVDLLVPQQQRDRAIAALVAAGFRGMEGEKDISHELNLRYGAAFVDLHWHLTRPGRARFDVAQEVVKRRERVEGICFPCPADELAILLFHPALSDQVTGRLLRAVDLALFAARYADAWHGALDLVTRAGLKTAAWATLSWAHDVVDLRVPAVAWQQLAPHALWQRYLRQWIGADPGALYARYPLLVRGAFNLALCDGVSGVARALLALRRAKAEAKRERGEIDRLLASGNENTPRPTP